MSTVLYNNFVKNLTYEPNTSLAEVLGVQQIKSILKKNIDENSKTKPKKKVSFCKYKITKYFKQHKKIKSLNSTSSDGVPDVKLGLQNLEMNETLPKS